MSGPTTEGVPISHTPLSADQPGPPLSKFSKNTTNALAALCVGESSTLSASSPYTRNGHVKKKRDKDKQVARNLDITRLQVTD
jgi:hypothetical protein